MTAGPLARLYAQLSSGEIDRRHFIQRSALLGVSTGIATVLANASAAIASGNTKNGFGFAAQEGTPAAVATERPAFGTEGQTRGEGGELKILQWQAATTANAHQSVGTKDFLISSMVQEPMMNYLPDGSIIANLVTEVPSVENGLLAEDLSTVTFKLKEGILWSDGEPLTSRDIQFTQEWISDPENASVSATVWAIVAGIETPDELTAVVTFTAPTVAWFEPFTGGTFGPILPAHAFNDNPKSSENPEFLTKPLGTGAYVITEFSPNDLVLLTANENYREANKPFFATVNVKGGGDAPSAARAVLQTGDYHFAWNLQVEPAIIDELQSDDSPGQFVSLQGVNVERIHINFTDPNTEVDGQRSEINTPHPFLSDPAVRQAMNKAVPRQIITDEFYGFAAVPTANILTGLEIFDSPNTSWEFNVEAAAALLDDAGWAMNGDVREKDGVQLVISYSTSINAVRQKTQAVVKQAFESIGIKVNLDQVDAGTYFDSGAGNDRNIQHNYWDISMYTSGPGSTVPASFMANWYAGPDNSNIAQKSNGWAPANVQRYVNPDYDAVYEDLLIQTSLEPAVERLIELNDILINDVAIIPEVNRPADTYAISRQLNNDNVAEGVNFEPLYWNVVNWRFV